VTLQGEPKKLLLAGDRVVVFSSMPKPVDPSGPQDPYAGSGAGAPAPYEPESDCTYGYDCDFTGDGHPVKLSVFDVTDRAEPRRIRELDLVTRQLELWPWELGRQRGKSRSDGRVSGLLSLSAVRFDGARGFVVTFRQTDPLHVLDLAEPEAPRVASTPTRGYFVAGVGLAHQDSTDLSATVAGTTRTTSFDAEVDPLLTLGVGLTHELDAFALLAQARLTTVFSDDEATRFIPIAVGAQL